MNSWEPIRSFFAACVRWRELLYDRVLLYDVVKREREEKLLSDRIKNLKDLSGLIASIEDPDLRDLITCYTRSLVPLGHEHPRIKDCAGVSLEETIGEDRLTRRSK